MTPTTPNNQLPKTNRINATYQLFSAVIFTNVSAVSWYRHCPNNAHASSNTSYKNAELSTPGHQEDRDTIPAYRLDRICVGVLVPGLPSVPGLGLLDRVRGEGSLPVTGHYRMVDEWKNGDEPYSRSIVHLADIDLQH